MGPFQSATANHRLFQIEKSFRMSKHDLQARPIYHRNRDSIEAHLTIVFAAPAVSPWIEDQTGRFDPQIRPPLPHQRDPGRTAHYHAADPLPNDLCHASKRSPVSAGLRANAAQTLVARAIK